MSLVHQRAEAARRTIDAIAALGLHEQSPASDQQRASTLLLELAGRRELFPPRDYPIKPGSSGGFYRLAEHADRRHALYVSVGVAGRRNNPHRHPSWAIIAGIAGDERNVVYRRSDDGSVPLRGKLEQVDDVLVGPGRALFMREGEYHHIEVAADQPALHLHLYGIGVDGPENAVAPVFSSPHSEEYALDSRPPGALRIGVPPLAPERLREARKTGAALVWIDLGGHALSVPEPALAGLDWPALLTRLPQARGTPLVLLGETDAVELASERLARHGYFCSLHWRGEP